MPGGAGGHVGDDALHHLAPVGPHQEHVTAGGGGFPRVFGEAAEIERGCLARDGGDARRSEFEIVELALMVDRLAVEELAQDGHGFHGAGVARGGGQGFAGEIRRDDVDGEPAAEDLIDGGDLAGELGQPHLADAHRHQQTDAAHLGGDGGGKRCGVKTERIARGEEDVVKPACFGLQHDVPAMLPGGLQLRVRLTEELVIVVAQRREPADFAGTAHGSRSPRAAVSTLYQSVRLQRGLKASGISAMRVTFWVPTSGIGWAGWAMIQL